MTENLYNTNPFENEPDNNVVEGSSVDYTPDEYYQENYGQQTSAQQTASAEQYAQYGEDFYSNPQNYAEPVNSTEETVNANPYTSSYSQNPYTSNQHNSTDYNSNPYTSNPYTSNPYSAPVQPKPVKQKKKKEKKPVTTKTLAAVLVIGILCSTVLGAVGGFAITNIVNKNKTITTGGLTINKSDGESVSHQGAGAALSTSEIVEKAADTVVEITTEAVVTGSFSQQYIQEGAGSGVIISTDGYIITNYHVIEGASQISVTMRNQTEQTSARLIGAYEEGDLALIKIDTDTELKAATFGDSDKLNVGDYAVAIGNPLGQLGGTVTDGIISALDREVTIDGETMNLLQTNAEISPGNSGGGLFNGSGELIGVVNAKSSTEAAEGLGFAIPVNDVQDVLADLKEYGYVTGQVYLGMSLIDISSTAEAWMYGVTQSGVYVASVDNGSNAAEAGFYGGDIIVEVNGTEVTTTAEVDAIIDKLSVGDEVTFKVNRNGQNGTLKMKLQEYTRSTTIQNNQQQQQQQEQYGGGSIWDIFGY